MVTDDGKFSYESDVLWLVEQARPYYYSIVLILIYFDLYTLALFYATAALSLIWEVDEVDRIEEDLRQEKRDLLFGNMHRVIDIEIMSDYLENVVLDPHFSNNDPLFTNYFNSLDSFLSVNNVPNLFIFEETVPSTYTAFDKSKIVKMDDKIDKAVQYREFNVDILKDKLMEFKLKTLTTSNPATRHLVKARMKKLVELADQFEYDILVYKISVESHNTVMLGLYLQMGLYPVSEYDFDVIAYGDINSIIYTDYLFFGFFYEEDLLFYNLDNNFNNISDDITDEVIDDDDKFISNPDYESKSDLSNLKNK